MLRLVLSNCCLIRCLIFLKLIVHSNHEYYNYLDVMELGLRWRWMLRKNVGYYQNQVVRIRRHRLCREYAVVADQPEQ